MIPNKYFNLNKDEKILFKKLDNIMSSIAINKALLNNNIYSKYLSFVVIL